MILKNIHNSMTKYWLNKLLSGVAAFMAAIAITGSITSCTNTDDTLGNDSFIPDGGDYKMYIDTLKGRFITSTIICDSIASDNLNSTYLGSQVTTKEGQINYSFVNQVWHYGVLDTDNNEYPFGYMPKVDSAFISLGVEYAMGPSDEKFKVYVYELKRALPNPIDSTYYSNFNVEEYIEKEPLFTIDAELGKQISMKLPNEYAQKFLALKGEEYATYNAFRSHFHGFYFKTSKVSSGNLVNKILPGSSGITIHYRNNKPDTSTFYVDFTKTYTDIYGQTYYVNEGFNIINRDYSYKDSNFGVKLDSKTITYASGMAGLLTKLEIPENVVEELKNLVKSKGGSKIIVANATMTLPVGETDINSLNQSLQSIGIYRGYQHFTSIYSRENTLDDYYINYSSKYSSVDIFGGALNRSTNNYRINVSSLIQGLVNGTADIREIEIATSYTDREEIGVASFENSDQRPIKLELTYSVVK